MRAADGFNPGFGKAKVLHLALLDQFLHGSRHVFYRHTGVNAMLIEKIDGINLESFSEASATSLICSGLLSWPDCPP